MPRGKKKAAYKGNRNATASRGGRHGLDSSTRPSNGAIASKQVENYGFTLQDEARNTGRHYIQWDSAQKLRYSAVNFVSGGNLDPTIPVEKPIEVDNTVSSLAHMAIDSAGEEMVMEVYEDPDQYISDVREVAGSYDHHTSFFVDTQAIPVSTGLLPPRVSSPTPSDSSAEIILFGGRDEYGRALSRPRQALKTISDPIDERIRQVEKEIFAKEELLEGVLHQRSGSARPKSMEHVPQTSGTEVEVEVTASPKKQIIRLTSRRSRQSIKQTEEEALVADYIANMDGDHDLLQSFGCRELGSAEGEPWQDETDQSSVESKLHAERSEWNRDDINDFEDLSTSDGVMGDVKDILSKRDRTSGLQYLVVWEDQAVEEARWVPVTTLTSANALLQVDKFESEEKLVAEFIGNSDSEEDSSDQLEEEDDMDIGGPAPRAPGRMSDERIARLLAKQQELGIDADELLLFDGKGDDEEDEDILLAHSFGAAPARGQKGNEGKSKSARRLKGEFPVASALADAYDGFDVMDFDRPSLRKRPKGRKGKLVFDLSDSELEASMVDAWETDRFKKKERKQEREDLRAQGLLGSKNGKPNLSAKYIEGMGLHQIKEEFQRFLDSDHTTLALPPMEKGERKAIHDLANAFDLKSKSAGSGKKRFPVLYKTQRTKPFFDHTFNAITARISRRFLPRPDVKHRKSAGGRDRGVDMSAVSYRDGDIVGASAPELGVENRGRAMLEKMGWSSGTALGALNNKGILQPVSHVVKTSKAGLG